MPSLDTNILVRYIVQDDAAQLVLTKALIRKCVREQLRLFVPITVTLELEWVLRASFGFSKDDTVHALSELLSAAELSFQSENALEAALHLYRSGKADFADCLHIALASEAAELPLWTFDKAAAKINGAAVPGK